MTKRDEKGRFVEQYPYEGKGEFEEQGPNKFDEEEAKQVASDTAWQNKREEILKRFGLWEEYKDK